MIVWSWFLWCCLFLPLLAKNFNFLKPWKNTKKECSHCCILIGIFIIIIYEIILSKWILCMFMDALAIQTHVFKNPSTLFIFYYLLRHVKILIFLKNEIVIFYTHRKSCFVVFFFSSETTEKNPQSNFSCQNLGLEHNSFKWDGKVTSLAAPSPSNSDINTVWQWLFHRILEKNYFIWLNFQSFLQRIKNLVQFSQTWFCFVQVCSTLIVHHIGKYVSYMLEAKVNFGMKIKMLGDKKGDFWGL